MNPRGDEIVHKQFNIQLNFKADVTSQSVSDVSEHLIDPERGIHVRDHPIPGVGHSDAMMVDTEECGESLEDGELGSHPVIPPAQPLLQPLTPEDPPIPEVVHEEEVDEEGRANVSRRHFTQLIHF